MRYDDADTTTSANRFFPNSFRFACLSSVLLEFCSLFPRDKKRVRECTELLAQSKPGSGLDFVNNIKAQYLFVFLSKKLLFVFLNYNVVRNVK